MSNKNHLLGRPLVFGDVEQIKALKAAELVAEGVKPAAHYTLSVDVDVAFTFTCPKCNSYNRHTETFYGVEEYDEDEFLTGLDLKCRQCNTGYEVKDDALFIKRH